MVAQTNIIKTDPSLTPSANKHGNDEKILQRVPIVLSDNTLHMKTDETNHSNLELTMRSKSDIENT